MEFSRWLHTEISHGGKGECLGVQRIISMSPYPSPHMGDCLSTIETHSDRLSVICDGRRAAHGQGLRHMLSSICRKECPHEKRCPRSHPGLNIFFDFICKMVRSLFSSHRFPSMAANARNSATFEELPRVTCDFSNDFIGYRR